MINNDQRLQAIIEDDIDRAFYNTELKEELRSLPTWQLDAVLANVVAKAGYGQRTMVRQQVNALQRAIRDVPEPSFPEAMRCDCNRDLI